MKVELQQGYAESFPYRPLPELPPAESDQMPAIELPIKSGVSVQVTFIHEGKAQIRTAWIEVMEGFDAVKAAHRALDKAIEKFLPAKTE